MEEILKYIAILSIVIGSNLIGGIYYNVNVKNIKFDWTKLANGAIKGMIIAIMFISLSYVFIEIPSLSEAIGINPMFIMNSAIVLYTMKTLVNLSKILGIELTLK